MTTQQMMLQEAFGTLLFAMVVIWAAIKIMNKREQEEEEEDDDIHLGV